MGRRWWFLWVLTPWSTCASAQLRTPYKNGEIPLTRCRSLSLSKQVQLYDRPSSRKTALEARFPGTFVAIYSRPPILVAWNFPLTSMKLYECCPLTSMHPRRLRTEQQKTWGFPVTFSIIIVHKVHLENVNSRVCVTQTSCFCVSSINQTKNQTKPKNTPNKHEHVSSKLVQVIARRRH